MDMLIRNKAVSCLVNNIRTLKLQERYQRQSVLGTARKCALRDICNEAMSYEQLRALFDEASQGKENGCFVRIFPVGKTHGIRIEQDDSILLYHLQNTIRISGKRLFPWDYPSGIIRFGKASAQSLKTIAVDLSKRTVPDFFEMYQVGENSAQSSAAHEQATIYPVDGKLQIVLDHHITFQYQDSCKVATEKYIADTWFYSDEEILRDLETKSVLAFGAKYRAFWE